MIACAITIGLLGFILYAAGAVFTAVLIGPLVSRTDPFEQFFVGICALLWPVALLTWLIVQIGKFGQE